MEILLFFILTIFVLIAFLQGGKHFASPWFLLCLITFASYCLVLLNYRNWQVVIYGKFVLYLSTALLFFGLGCVLVKTFMRCPSLASERKTPQEAGLEQKYPLNLFLVISLVCSLLYISKLLMDAGSEGSLSERIRHIYDMTVEESYTPGFFFNQMMEIVVAIAYINTYRLLQRIYSKKDHVGIVRLVSPIVIFIFVVLFTTDRNKFLRYVIYFLALYVIFFRKNRKKRHANLLLLVRVSILLVIAVFLFFLLGVVKQYSSNLTRAISIYGGSGLYNFNLWLEKFDGNLSHGTATFSAFLHALETILGQKFGMDLAPRFDPFIEYTSPNGYVYSSNIYSALMPYVQDFGEIGVIFIPFFTGMFFQFLFGKTKQHHYGFATVIYCALVYQIAFYPISEQLFHRWTLGIVYEIFWLTVLFFFVYRRRRVAYAAVPKRKGVAK